MQPRPLPLLLFLVLVSPAPALAQGGASGVNELISTRADGSPSALNCWAPSLSPDGRWVAFHTNDALLPEDTNGLPDVYARDRSTGQLVLVSSGSLGEIGNAPSYFGSVSAEGRYVAFESRASNLVAPDTNALPDVYVKDLVSGETTRISNAMGTGAASHGASDHAVITPDGRYVAFRGTGMDLAPGKTVLRYDIYRYDRWTDTMLLVSVGSGGEADGNSGKPEISDDGSRVVYESWAGNLVAVDDNGVRDVFVTEIGGSTRLFSRRPDGLPANGQSGNPSISGDGTVLAFESFATDLGTPTSAALNVWVSRFTSLACELGTVDSDGIPASDSSLAPSLSSDGRFLSFVSYGAGLASFQSSHIDVFVRDLVLGRTWAVSRPSGVDGSSNGDSGGPALSADGSRIAFSSRAKNIAPGSSGEHADTYVRTLHPDPLTYCTGSTTSTGCAPSLRSSGFPSTRANGGFTVLAEGVPSQRLGLAFYGFSGRASIPFAGATLCVAGPRRRTAPMHSGGSPPAVDDCSGSFALDLNALAAGQLSSAPHPALQSVGARIQVQFWGRDPGSPHGVFLTDALEYVASP